MRTINKITVVLGVVLASVVTMLGLAGAPPAHAALQLSRTDVSLGKSVNRHIVGQREKKDAEGNTIYKSDGSPVLEPIYAWDEAAERQAGAHPDLTFDVDVASDAQGNPDEQAKDIDLDLPKGLVGNPTAYPTCSSAELANGNYDYAACPVNSQIGTANIKLLTGPGGPLPGYIGIYNLEHGPETPARFGFKFFGVTVTINARVRPGDYGISSGSMNTSQGANLNTAKIKLWGVPGDPIHDGDRVPPFAIPSPFSEQVTSGQFVFPNTASRQPFLTNQTRCDDTPSSFTVRGSSWENPDIFDTHTLSADPNGDPFVFSGCELLSFNPKVDVKPVSQVADTPTGLGVDVEVPQNEDPDGLASSQVKRVTTTFPKGVTVSPSSAGGLGACSLAQINLNSNGAPTCPDSAKLGTVAIDTPLLDEQLKGDVLLAKQGDNPFNSLVALYIAVKGPGFYLKLPGKIDLDPVSGQVTATFDNTPQLPFNSLRLKLNSGSRAALSLPKNCGTYTTYTTVTPWSGGAPAERSDSFNVTDCPQAGKFDPSLNAGAADPVAGRSSTFMLNVSRPSGQQDINGLDVTLPTGLLAKIKSVPQCGDAEAAKGSCPAASQVGKVRVLAGPGTTPISVPEVGKAPTAVYLGGPYKGAPFSLSIVVPAQAGPFDLGTVIVRAALFIDERDAHVTVKSDPIPTILQGIPLAVQQFAVTMDKPSFMRNPTDCSVKKITGVVSALEGASAAVSSRFQVGECAKLALKPKLALALSGRDQLTDGKHPGLKAILSQKDGQSNLKKVAVKLPLSLALDPDNAQGLCEYKDSLLVDPKCPKGSIVGSAAAWSPILNKKLTSPVYFAKNVRVNKYGRQVKTLPTLVLPLRGENGLKLNIIGKSSVSANKLVTTFAVPDAPVSRFQMSLKGGSHGILVANSSVCKRDRDAVVLIDGHNGKQTDSEPAIRTPCAKASKKSKKAKNNKKAKRSSRR